MSGTGNSTKLVTATGSQFIDGVLTNVAWADATIYYSFSLSSAAYSYTGTGLEDLPANFNTISAAQQTAIHFALNSDIGPIASDGFSVEGFTNLGITSLGNTNSSTAEIRFGETSSGLVGTARVGDFPGNYVSTPVDDNGDVWFGTDYNFRTPEAGNYSWHTNLHEIGHALGLKHGQESWGWGAMPSQRDSMEYSVMTYRSYEGGPLTGYSNETWGFAQSFMMADIAALQKMYGADFSTNSSNTVYKWNPNSGDTLVNGQVGIDAGGNRIFATIWDGGGKDTYDLTAYSDNLVIDLRPGGYSKFSDVQLANLGTGEYARGNIFNALLFEGDKRSLIENAKGGSGDDLMLGNQAKNKLKGNDGNDTLKGASNNDTLIGGSGDDKLIGGGGKDKLFGSGGKDKLDGGRGNDKLKGNGGNDTFVFKKGYDKDKIIGFQDNKDTIQLNDNLWNGNKSVNKVLNQFGSQNGNDFVLNFGGGDILIIKNTSKSQLQNDIDII